MKIGAFEIDEPLPELHEPHALAMLRPWIDIGNVGTLVLTRLETLLRAQELGRIARPGNFFDFTRYRPIMYLKKGKRAVVIPNTYITYATRSNGNDFLFLHLLEPHMLGETYVESVLLLLKKMGVKRYCLLGSMYDFVPHTRPLIVTGGGHGRSADRELKKAGVQTSDYQGPTTITYLASLRAAEMGIETMTIVVHLPQYSELEEDYMGQVCLMEVLNKMYGIPVPDADIRKAEQQRKSIDAAVAGNPQVKEIMTQLESLYDSRTVTKEETETAPLSPQIERFLREMEKRFRQN